MNKLKELRKGKGYTIKELSEIVHISASSLCCMETEVRPFTQQNLEILCKYFNVSADYMLGRSSSSTIHEEHPTQLTVRQQYILDSIEGLNSDQMRDLIKYIEYLKVRDLVNSIKDNKGDNN